MTESTIVRTPTGSWAVDITTVGVATALLLAHPVSIFTVAILIVAAGFAVWRWLSIAEIGFDETGLTVSDRLWRLGGNAPVRFEYSDGVALEASALAAFPSIRINGLMVMGTFLVKELPAMAESKGLEFEIGQPKLHWLYIALLLATIIPLREKSQAGLAAGVAAFAALLVVVVGPYLLNRPQWREEVAGR